METAPTLFYEYDNETALPVGAKLKVNGNIDDKAIITLPYSGVVKVTEALQFLHITVEAGKVTEAKGIARYSTLLKSLQSRQLGFQAQAWSLVEASERPILKEESSQLR